MRSTLFVMLLGLSGHAGASSVSQNVDAQDENGISALMQASIDGKVEVARALLDQGASIDIVDAQGYNAMDYAMERYQNGVVQALIAARIKRAAVSDVDRVALAMVASDALLPSTDDISPNITAPLLLLAAARGHDENSRRLLAGGLAADAGIDAGYSGLAMAARWGRTGIVKQLLAAGADANAHTYTRYLTTPLMEASRDGRVAIAELLIAAGARVNEPDRHGDHALNWAAYFGHADFVALMVKHGADLKRTGQTDDQPIEIAIREKHADVIKVLSAAGAVARFGKAGNAGSSDTVK